jgi:hypothetical protein
LRKLKRTKTENLPQYPQNVFDAHENPQEDQDDNKVQQVSRQTELVECQEASDHEQNHKTNHTFAMDVLKLVDETVEQQNHRIDCDSSKNC